MKILFEKSVIVDMEEGVINEILKSGEEKLSEFVDFFGVFLKDLGELFEEKQFLKDVSGAGNNW